MVGADQDRDVARHVATLVRRDADFSGASANCNTSGVPSNVPRYLRLRAQAKIDAIGFDMRLRLKALMRPWSGVCRHTTGLFALIFASTVTLSWAGCPRRPHLTPRQSAARSAFSVALGRIPADVLA